MSEQPWWHPTSEDDWDEPLPEVVLLAAEYAAELPLSGAGHGLAWQLTKLTPELLDRLAAWQQEFDSEFHWQRGWSSTAVRDRWASAAQELAADVQRELGGRAKLALDLWPLRDDDPGGQKPDQ